MRTRQMRVGWLGIGVILVVTTAASAGPSFIRFDESDPIESTPVQKSADLLLIRAESVDSAESPSFSELAEMPVAWHAVPELDFSAPTPQSAIAAVEYRAQPLSVPLQFGWLGVLAITTVGSYLGARWVGIRRNHSR